MGKMTSAVELLLTRQSPQLIRASKEDFCATFCAPPCFSQNLCLDGPPFTSQFLCQLNRLGRYSINVNITKGQAVSKISNPDGLSKVETFRPNWKRYSWGTIGFRFHCDVPDLSRRQWFLSSRERGVSRAGMVHCAEWDLATLKTGS
jgi:hypothetical protein